MEFISKRNPYFKNWCDVLTASFSIEPDFWKDYFIDGWYVPEKWYTNLREELRKDGIPIDDTSKFAKVVNNRFAELGMEDPSIQKVTDNESKPSRELAYSFYILWISSHAHTMHQRDILNDSDWAGWLQWMRNAFRKGTIKQMWTQIERDRWFNPAFQNFVNMEIVPGK